MPSGMLAQYTISNLVAVLLFITALFRPKVARVAFAALFILAGLVNTFLVLRDPRFYVTGFGPFAVSIYRDFIYSALAQSPVRLVLPIALGQIFLGLLTLTAAPWMKVGLVGMLEFLIMICPLGLACAFPAPLILATGVISLVRRQWPEPAVRFPGAQPEPEARIKACVR